MVRKPVLGAWGVLAAFIACAPVSQAIEVDEALAASFYQVLPNIVLPKINGDDRTELMQAEIISNLQRLNADQPDYALQVFSTLSDQFSPSDAKLLKKNHSKFSVEEKTRAHAVVLNAIKSRGIAVNCRGMQHLADSEDDHKIKEPEFVEELTRKMKDMVGAGSLDAPFLGETLKKELEESEAVLRRKNLEYQQRAVESRMAHLRQVLVGYRTLRTDPAVVYENPLEHLKKDIERYDPYKKMIGVRFYTNEHGKYVVVDVGGDASDLVGMIPVEFDGLDVAVRQPGRPIMGLNGERKEFAILDGFQRNMKVVLGRISVLFGVHGLYRTQDAKVLKVHNANYQIIIEIWEKLKASKGRPTQDEAKQLLLHLRVFDQDLREDDDLFYSLYRTILRTLEYYSGAKA